MASRKHLRKPAGFRQKYSGWFSDKGRFFRLPMLSVRLISPSGRSLITNALVDSGATVSFLPPDLAGALGLLRKKKEVSYGAGGSFSVWSSTVSIQYLKKGRAMSAPERVEVRVPYSGRCIPYAVLGRDSVFLLYNVMFRERAQTIELISPGKS